MTITVMDSLSEIDQANVVRCARLLLRRPLLRAGGPDGDLLALVYRHRSALVELFAATLGYRLVVERRFARLYKAGPGADPTRSDAALSPRGYAYLALSLAVLTGVGYQVLLSRLVADIRGAAESAGIVVRDDLAERRSLAAALRHLIAVGVIVETDGSVAGLLGDASAEALITVDTALLGQLPIGPIAEADTPLRLIALAQRPGPRGVEHAVRRRLVENPVTHYADLPEEQAAWLRRRGRRESELLERYFGLQTETRAEGVAVTDPDDSLTDIVFPGQSTSSRIALLALPRLLAEGTPSQGLEEGRSPPERATRADGRIAVTRGQIGIACAEISAAYPTAWAKQSSENLPALTEEVVRLWRALGLVEPAPEPRTPRGDGSAEWWLLSPAAHRWLPQPDDTPRTEAPNTDDAAPDWPAEASLFDPPPASAGDDPIGERNPPASTGTQEGINR